MSDLTELGLSSYEEKAYRTLLSLGPAPASDVSETSGVPKGRVYDVLNGLANRELVTTVAETDPRRYVAVDPSTAIERLLAERRADLCEKRERYDRLASRAREHLAQTAPSEGRFWATPLGSDAAIDGMRDQFNLVDESLLSVVAGAYETADLDVYQQELDAYMDLLDSNVEVKLLTTPTLIERTPHDTLTAADDTISNFEARTMTGINLSYDVLDGTETYFGLQTPFSSGERLGSIVVRDDALATELEHAFRAAWKDARPVTAVGVSDEFQ